MKKKVLLILIIYLTNFANAVEPSWINYTNGDNVLVLVEEGNIIWIGTSGGLVKLNKITGIPTFYNGSNSGLPDNNISSLTIDENGTKWI